MTSSKPSSTIVIVESGAKAKTISKYLNNDRSLTSAYGSFTVVASFGHINDLDKKSLSVDLETFEPTYIVSADKRKTVTSLRKEIARHDLVLLASDADREGASIAHQIQTTLLPKGKPSMRIVFTEITPSALKAAVENASPTVDADLVAAQQARRVMDRLVGYTISPLLWKSFKASYRLVLSAGRVQSAVLNLICSREEDIGAFETSPYWTILGSFSTAHTGVSATLHDDSKAGVCKLTDAQDVVHTLQEQCKQVTVDAVTVKRHSQSAPRPFVTSTLQQEAHDRHGFGLKLTMGIAQALYEQGLITYMRTDSYAMAQQAKDQIRAMVAERYGARYVVDAAPTTQTRRKKEAAHRAQEAHECIRPTDAGRASEDLPSGADKNQRLLYDLIWRRAVASQMAAMTYDEQVVKMGNASLKDAGRFFLAKRKRTVFDGYTLVYDRNSDDIDSNDHDIDNSHAVAVVKEGETLRAETVRAHNTWTSPPARFNESTLVRLMESEGIGRPSTYAGILTKLQERTFVTKTPFVHGKEHEAIDFTIDFTGAGKVQKEVRKTMVGEERGTRLVPSTTGSAINAFTRSHFPDIADKGFTSQMEDTLDGIAAGKAEYVPSLKRFYARLRANVDAFDSGPKSSPKRVGTDVNAATRTMHSIDGAATYTLRTTKYGPVVAVTETGSKTARFVNLRMFFTQFKKDLETISAPDVRFLVALPIPLKKDPGVSLHYGRYGFYLSTSTGKKGAIYASRVKRLCPDNDPRRLVDIAPSEILDVLEYKKTTKRNVRQTSPKSHPSAQKMSR